MRIFEGIKSLFGFGLRVLGSGFGKVATAVSSVGLAILGLKKLFKKKEDDTTVNDIAKSEKDAIKSKMKKRFNKDNNIADEDEGYTEEEISSDDGMKKHLKNFRKKHAKAYYKDFYGKTVDEEEKEKSSIGSRFKREVLKEKDPDEIDESGFSDEIKIFEIVNDDGITVYYHTYDSKYFNEKRCQEIYEELEENGYIDGPWFSNPHRLAIEEAYAS